MTLKTHLLLSTETVHLGFYDTGKEYFHNAVIQLDRFHLMRDLRIAVGKGTANKLIKILNDGKLKAFVDTLEPMETVVPSDKKKRFTKNFVT